MAGPHRCDARDLSGLARRIRAGQADLADGDGGRRLRRQPLGCHFSRHVPLSRPARTPGMRRRPSPSWRFRTPQTPPAGDGAYDLSVSRAVSGAIRVAMIVMIESAMM